VLEQHGAHQVLKWRGRRKPSTLIRLITLLRSEGLETERDLQKWLPQNRERLLTINGIKDKTADYLQILVGEQGVAIDRHLNNFIEAAGVRCANYEEARAVLIETAKLMDVSPSTLDYSIWKYMRGKRESTGIASSGGSLSPQQPQ
jgi:endonuclease III